MMLYIIILKKIKKSCLLSREKKIKIIIRKLHEYHNFS